MNIQYKNLACRIIAMMLTIVYATIFTLTVSIIKLLVYFETLFVVLENNKALSTRLLLECHHSNT